MAEPQRLKDLAGVGDVLADRIRRHLGNGSETRALELIKLDPYLLLTVPRVGFLTADRIALAHYRVKHEDVNRHRAGNAYILAERGSMELREFDKGRERLELRGVGGRFEGVAYEEGRVWLPKVLEAERACARWAVGLPLGTVVTGLSGALSRPEEALLSELDAMQRRAALNAVRGPHQVLGITGGAGTGKTRVVAAIAALGQERGQAVAVLAPTGKAADRAREAMLNVGVLPEAMTIHRALGWGRHAQQGGITLPYDVIVLDEASMISVDLFWGVVQATRKGARLIVVGDPGQLPPVGHGQPFMDLLTLGLPHVHLEQNHRQRNVQGIIDLASSIRNRKPLDPTDPFELDNSVNAKVAQGDEADQLATQAVEALRGQPLDDWQIITWTNEDVHAFNTGVQEILNPGGLPLFTYRPHAWGDSIEVRAGDRVVVTKNDPDYGIFNGQLGVAQDIQDKPIMTRRPAETLDDHMVADDDGMVTEVRQGIVVMLRIGDDLHQVELKDAEDLLQLGYAITVHKAQGSDWEHVLLLQPRDVGFDAARWWYTAVTRARSRLSILYTAKKDSRLQMNMRRTVVEAESTLLARMKRALREDANQRTQAYLLTTEDMTPEQLRAEGERRLS